MTDWQFLLCAACWDSDNKLELSFTYFNNSLEYQKFANSLVKKFRSFNCNELNKMFYYWQNEKLKLTSFEVVFLVGFIRGFTQKKPPGFFWVCTRVSEPWSYVGKLTIRTSSAPRQMQLDTPVYDSSSACQIPLDCQVPLAKWKLLSRNQFPVL